MKEEAISRLRIIDIDKESSSFKAEVATHRNQINLAYLLYHLPKAIQMKKEDLDKREEKVTKMKAAQEGGEI